jgi:hypothetical protein
MGGGVGGMGEGFPVYGPATAAGSSTWTSGTVMCYKKLI